MRRRDLVIGTNRRRLERAGVVAAAGVTGPAWLLVTGLTGHS